MYPTIDEARIAHQMRAEAALGTGVRGVRERRLRSRWPVLRDRSHRD